MSASRTRINIPGRPNLDIPVFEGKVPKPEDVTLFPPAMIRASRMLTDELKDASFNWAIGGDAGEIIKGVNLKTDHLEVLTTREGCEEICRRFSAHVKVPPADAEKKLDRDADVAGKMYPVFVRSHYAEVEVGGVRVEVYGDEQIRVGEWEWGDPLDFEPDYTYIIRSRVPVVPLRLKQELDLGLGWLDRLGLIAEALARGQHHIVEGGVKRPIVGSPGTLKK